MKIYLLTPIYATKTTMQGATPVVHYFAREWVKMGHEVKVFHLGHKFPRPFYWVSKRFQHQLNTRLGILVALKYPVDGDYEADGVSVRKRYIKKVIPHSRFSKGGIKYAFNLIVKECEKNGAPDWFVGHWDNPQLELLYALKQKFNKPTCLVLHSNRFNFEKLYGDEAKKMLAQLDVVGFRNKAAKDDFVKKYGQPKGTFIAYSGVSEAFLKIGEINEKQLSFPVKNFIYVGSFISRKYPTEIMKALYKAYPDGDFCMTYIGDGAEKNQIEEEYRKHGEKGTLKFTGRIPREDIIQYLKQADVFVMISKSEIFGLVYLEAMALGVIPIGSKGEGIDGVIVNRENGFLCEPGNVNELTDIINRIKNMEKEELHRLSHNARKTAESFSDYGVAKQYIDSLRESN